MQLPRDLHQVGGQGGRGGDLLQVGRGGIGGGLEDVGRGQGGWSRDLHHQLGQHLLCGIDKEEEEVYFDNEDKEVQEEIFFINLDNIDLVFFLFVVFIDKEEEVE